LVINKKDINDYALNYRTAAVDLLPTIADYMNIAIDQSTLYELDGLSLFSPADAFNLKGVLIDNCKLLLSWTSISKNSDTTAEVYISTTNNIKEGNPDRYIKIGEVPLKEELALLSIEMPEVSDFLKVVLKTPNHTLNYWVRKVGSEK
jgi:hypothetical protein